MSREFLSLSLLGLGLGLLTTVLSLATQQQGVPPDRLGVRTHGRGLWTYLFDYYFLGSSRNSSGSSSAAAFVRGYDPILGALSPPLRLLAHVSTVLVLWSLVLRAWPGPSVLPDADLVTVGGAGFSPRYGGGTAVTLTLSFVQSGTAVALTYLFFHYLLNHRLRGVSDPGGPRLHKIQRRPMWRDVNTTLGNNAGRFRYVTGMASHLATETRLAGTSAALTGEPAGRDIWASLDGGGSRGGNNAAAGFGGGAVTKKVPRKVDERLVKEMASGGRDDGGVFNPSKNPNSCDYPFRAQLIRDYLAGGNKPPAPRTVASGKVDTVKDCLYRAVHFYSMLQTEDGHWSGDYGGPMFLMPGLVVAWYMMGRPDKMLGANEVEAMVHYITVHQQADGGWGTHIESPSTMFGTTMNYVALRLLGVDANDPACRDGRIFIKDQGGALMTSSWAKFSLCMLGCMHWDGHNSVPPEMWLLPNWFPFHPGRMWCHARMVYLPMGYIYGSRLVYRHAETDPVVLALRSELYCQPYGSIDWARTRHWVAPMDDYSPINPFMRFAQNLLARYESSAVVRPFREWVRTRGLRFCAEYMAAEDLQTNFIDIGPVNKVFNMIAAYHLAGGDLNHTTVSNHMARVADYLWLAEDGMKMKGYNGSQCWDTSFAIQAIYEAKLLDDFPVVSERVWSYLERTQILSTEVSQATAAFRYESASNRSKYYRHISQGGWPFSTSAHGWPISDCTSEGLKGALCLMKSSRVVQAGLESGALKPIGDKRLQSAVNVLLTYQNEDGGWATYENNRGFGWYEALNPSEVFGDIMIDYSYVECSMATLTALADFHEAHPKHRADDICHALTKGCEFLKSVQREDGSWYGSWACCFTYGCWFGVEGLVKCGEPLHSPCIVKACTFLLSHQRPNGGWGEDFTSCYDKDYSSNGMEMYGDDGSGVVNTAWALLALSAAQCDDVKAVKRGVRYLIDRQLPFGDWPQEGIAGVFNRACGITYTAYRNIFPIWALGRCREVYGSALDA